MDFKDKVCSFKNEQDNCVVSGTGFDFSVPVNNLLKGYSRLYPEQVLQGNQTGITVVGGARNTKKKRRGQGRRRIRSKLVRKVNNKSSNKKNKKKSSIKRNKN